MNIKIVIFKLEAWFEPWFEAWTLGPFHYVPASQKRAEKLSELWCGFLCLVSWAYSLSELFSIWRSQFFRLQSHAHSPIWKICKIKIKGFCFPNAIPDNIFCFVQWRFNLPVGISRPSTTKRIILGANIVSWFVLRDLNLSTNWSSYNFKQVVLSVRPAVSCAFYDSNIKAWLYILIKVRKNRKQKTNKQICCFFLPFFLLFCFSWQKNKFVCSFFFGRIYGFIWPLALS